MIHFYTSKFSEMKTATINLLKKQDRNQRTNI